jgi:hypothetical protein
MAATTMITTMTISAMISEYSVAVALDSQPKNLSQHRRILLTFGLRCSGQQREDGTSRS